MTRFRIAVAVLAAMTSFAGATAVQAGGFSWPKFKITFTNHPAVAPHSIGSESNPPTPFGTCNNLAGVQQAGTADEDGFCVPAESLVGSVAGFDPGSDASCTITKTVTWKGNTRTLWEKEKSGECPSKPHFPPMGNRQ